MKTKKKLEKISVRAISLGRGMKRREGRDGEDSDDYISDVEKRARRACPPCFHIPLLLMQKGKDSDD